MMKRITVFFNDAQESFATVLTSYAWSKDICEKLNTTNLDEFLDIEGIICKPSEVSKVIVEDYKEDTKKDGTF